jgi:hypothetical protein
MQQPTIVFMRSPEGELKEVTVIDPNQDLVPLMVAGYHQVQVAEMPSAPEEKK